MSSWQAFSEFVRLQFPVLVALEALKAVSAWQPRALLCSGPSSNNWRQRDSADRGTISDVLISIQEVRQPHYLFMLQLSSDKSVSPSSWPLTAHY